MFQPWNGLKEKRINSKQPCTFPYEEVASVNFLYRLKLVKNFSVKDIKNISSFPSIESYSFTNRNFNSEVITLPHIAATMLWKIACFKRKHIRYI